MFSVQSRPCTLGRPYHKRVPCALQNTKQCWKNTALAGFSNRRLFNFTTLELINLISILLRRMLLLAKKCLGGLLWTNLRLVYFVRLGVARFSHFVDGRRILLYSTISTLYLCRGCPFYILAGASPWMPKNSFFVQPLPPNAPSDVTIRQFSRKEARGRRLRGLLFAKTAPLHYLIAK